MAYLNNNNNFYSPFVTPNEFDPYPFLQSQKFANPEEAYNQPVHTFTDSWSTVDQPGPLNNTSANHLGTTSYVLPAFNSYPTTSLGPFWPMNNEPTCPGYTGVADLSASKRGWETPAQVLTVNPVSTDWWSPQQYEVPMGASYRDNLPNCHNPGPSVIRTGVTGRRRFTPYGTYNTRPWMYGNAEAGPSAQLPSHGTWSTTQPTGGHSETTADAEQTKSTTEEDETPTPRTRRPRGHGAARPHRERNRSDALKLNKWVKTLRGSRELPTHQDAITTVAELISIIWRPVYNEHRLFIGHGQRAMVGSYRANKEHRRRNETREVYKRLSQYYPLEKGRSTWTTTQLLVKVLDDIDAMNDAMRNL